MAYLHEQEGQKMKNTLVQFFHVNSIKIHSFGKFTNGNLKLYKFFNELLFPNVLILG